MQNNFNNMQDNSQQTFINQPPPEQVPAPPLMPQPTPKPKTVTPIWVWIIAGLIVVGGIVGCLVYFAGLNQNAGTKGPASQPPAATTPTTTPATPAASKPPSTPAVQPPAAAATPVTPPATPVVTPPPQTPAQPSNPPSASPVSSGTLINKQAYQLVLTLADMGTGWMQSSAASPSRPQVTSSSHMNFTQGSSFSPVVQSMASVFRSVEAAQNAYEAEKPANTATGAISHPNIGDECFLNDSVPNNKVLVFRKSNVVAWIIVQQDKTSDLLPYARTVEQKIIQ